MSVDRWGEREEMHDQTVTSLSEGEEDEETSTDSKKRARLPTMPRWTVEESRRLVQWVRRHGKLWRKCEAEGGFPLRSAYALRMQFGKVKSDLEVLALEEEATTVVQPEPLQLIQEATAALLSMRRRVDAELVTPTDSGERNQCELRKPTWEDLEYAGWKRARRTARQGRPWEYGIRLELEPTRNRHTFRSLQARSLWKLGKCKYPFDILAVNFRRAYQIVKREFQKMSPRPAATHTLWYLTMTERDRMGLVWYPGDTLNCFVGGHDNVLWIDGPRITKPRFMAASELLVLMGGRCDSAEWLLVRKYLANEQERWELVADSVYVPLAELAIAIVIRELAWKEGTEVAYGSFYSGGLDPFFPALRRAGMSCQHLLLAEKIEVRRAVLREARAVPYAFACVSQAARVVTIAKPRLVVFTPSCKRVSPGRIVAKADIAENVKVAREELMVAAEAVARVALEDSVHAVIIEQSVGLRDFTELYEEFCARLKRTGLDWQHGVVDAVELGACHHRSRLLWVGWKGSAVMTGGLEEEGTYPERRQRTQGRQDQRVSEPRSEADAVPGLNLSASRRTYGETNLTPPPSEHDQEGSEGRRRVQFGGTEMRWFFQEDAPGELHEGALFEDLDERAWRKAARRKGRALNMGEGH